MSLPLLRDTVQPLGQEDPLEKGMATHSSILAWEMPWTEEPGGLPNMGLQRSQRRLGVHTCCTASSLTPQSFTLYMLPDYSFYSSALRLSLTAFF